MKGIYTLLFFLISISLIFAWTYVTRVDHEQPAPGELTVYINSDTQPGEGVAVEARWPSGGPYSYANTRDQGTMQYGSYLGGTANWKVTFNTGVLPNNMSIDYQVMGIGNDNNFYSHSGFNWTVDGALPVELTTFNASIFKNKVMLEWETATEINNFGFEIQKQILENNDDNVEWRKIGFVEGSGNSNSSKSYSFSDNSITGGVYKYRLKQIDIDGKFEYSDIVEVDFEAPTKFSFNQNYPNPFNPSTTIEFSLPEAGDVQLAVFNSIGEKVTELINKNMDVGYHNVKFNAENLKSGIYFYRIQFNDVVMFKKMILLK